MTCNGCAEIVHDRLSKVSGVQNVIVSLTNEQAEIESDQPVQLQDLKVALKETIYSISDNTEKYIAPEA